MHTSYLPTGQWSCSKEVIQIQVSSNINPRRQSDKQFFLKGEVLKRTKGGNIEKEKRQGWEALSHNALHILRELQLHSKVSTSRLIFLSLSICSALRDNYAILKNRALKKKKKQQFRIQQNKAFIKIKAYTYCLRKTCSLD